MTNAERFIGDEEIIDEFIADLVEFLPKRLHRHYDGEKAPLYGALVDFFKSEVKPTLTEDERVILKNICFTPLKDFYIERRHGTLKLHNKVDELYDFFAYDHLFQFIKERRRISNSRTFERRIEMTNEEVYKKAIRLSKEDLIDMVIEWNNDNRRLRDIILKYEEFTNAGIKEMCWTPQHPYSGYRVKVNDNFEYCRDVSGGRTEKNIVYKNC